MRRTGNRLVLQPRDLRGDPLPWDHEAAHSFLKNAVGELINECEELDCVVRESEFSDAEDKNVQLCGSFY
jgi:hypothetical protein